MKRIAIIDDHKLFLDGFGMVLANMDSTLQVDKFESPRDFLTGLIDNTEYDLIISDLSMAEMNGLAMIKEARNHTKAPVLMLSGLTTDPPFEELRALGVHAYAHKSIDSPELIRTVRAILDGDGSVNNVPPNGRDPYRQEVDKAPDPFLSGSDRVTELTDRQIEVLRLISEGASNREISDQLSISENTVKSHLKIIFDILKVNKRTACVRTAQSLGLI